MTIKSFAFDNPIDESAVTRNWRQFQENSTFRVFTPTTSDIINPGTIFGYAQLYGPLVYYYIRMKEPAAGFITAGAAPRIRSLPYGVETPSGSKTSVNPQWLKAVDQNGNDLVTGQQAMFRSVAGTIEIVVPTWVGNKSELYFYGWIFRDA